MRKSIAVVTLLTLTMATASAQDVQPKKEVLTLWAQSYQLERNGKYEQAAAVLLPKLESGKEQEYARMRYAWLNYMQGNFNDAIRNYKQAIQQNSRSIEARVGIALPLMAQNRWKEASRYLKQVLGMSPFHYTAHLRLMLCEEGLRQWSTLEKHAASFAATYPTDTSILVYLARAYAWQDKQTQASQAYQRVLVRFPNHYEAARFLARENE